MNIAFMAKIGWRMEKERHKLWVDVLNHKYSRGKEGISSIKEKQGASNLWRGINAAKQSLTKGVCMHVYNGNHVSFWNDHWIDKKSLRELSNTKVPDTHINRMVADYWQQGVGWKWEELQGKLSEEIKERMQLMILSNDANGRDEAYWALENSGNFSTSSAYHNTNLGNIAMQDEGWEKIWKLKIPNRIKTLLWLTRHEKLLCNEERRKHHLTWDGSCAVCHNGCETVEHAIKKCPEARSIWRKLLGDGEVR